MSAQATAVGQPRISAKKLRKRILTGDRPTAKSFHLGNYYGTLQNRVRLQDEYESYFLIADYHMLTTRVTDLEEIGQNIRELVTDYLAVGIDPNKTTIYLQSLIPEVTELFLYFAMLVTVPRAERIPTLKDKMRDHNLAVPTYGLLGYPILQAADIAIYKASHVPVGKDQAAHLELSREIVRAFNHRYGQTFPEPQAVFTEAPVVLGTDGTRKMSKSVGNTIDILGEPDLIRRQVMSMVTDTQRILRTDPGRPEVCNVCHLQPFFGDDYEDLWEGERTARTGCVDMKRLLGDRIVRHYAPARERYLELIADPAEVDGILEAGADKLRPEAEATLAECREKMGLR
jgi:tryptophanyl-tRNA synthetase